MKNKLILILSLILVLCCAGLFGCFGNGCFVTDEIPTGDPHTITVQQTEHGVLTVDKQTAHKNEKVTVTGTPNKAGYHFNCYEVNGELYFSNETTFKMPGEAVVIVPYFGTTQYRITYKISWAKGEDMNTPGLGDYDYTVLDEKDLPVAIKTGYNFVGWYTLDNPDRVFTKITPGMMTGNVDLYPKFEITEYKLHFIMPEGATHDNRESYTVEDEDFTLTDPVYENHYFLGWYTDSKFEDAISIIETKDKENYWLYPKFYSELYDDEGYRLITSETDFEYILSEPSGTIEGKYRLTDDLDLSSERVSQWQSPKNYSIRRFEGEFDGGNHTIKGNHFFVVNTTEKGLFQEIYNATIKNLRFEVDEEVEHESDFYKAYVGLISTAQGNNVIENVHLDKLHLTLTSNAKYVIGGILAYAETGTTTITGCSVKDVKISATLTKLGYSDFYVGAMVGYGDGVTISRSSVTFESDDCIFVSAGSANDSSSMIGIGVGGMAGVVDNINDSFVYMNKDSYISLYLSSSYTNVVAFLGGMAGSMTNLYNCYACVSELRLITKNTEAVELRAFVAGLSGSNVSNAKNCFLTAPSSELKIKTSERIIYYDIITRYNTTFNAGIITTSKSTQSYGELSELYTNCDLYNLVSSSKYTMSSSSLNDNDKVKALSASSVFNGFKNNALWDFDTIWQMNSSVNDGLPMLRPMS